MSNLYLRPGKQSLIPEKKKICFIVGTLDRGGAERQLLYMLRALKDSGAVSCRVLCLTNGESYEKDIKSLEVPVRWVGQSKNRGLRLLSIVKNIRKEPVDIIQSSHFYTNIYAGLAGKILGVPSIGAIRSDLHRELKKNGYLGRWQLFLPSFLITNSRLAYGRAIKKGILPEDIEFVKNVVDTEFHKPAEVPKVNSPVRLLFVGRLDRNKRPGHFVEMAAALTEQLPEVCLQFLIAGDGELRKKLEDRARELGLSSEKMRFLGVCNNMRKIYRQAGIVISTSNREGTSNVILEAMAYGVPVIATNVGGTPEVLDESRGILIEPDNDKQLVEAAIKLILNRELRESLGSNGRRYVENNHSVKYLQNELIRIYDKIF